jgi:formyltetrahydrofolate synthetase
MNINKNENSLKNNLYDADKITSKKIKFFNLKFIHRIFDSVNISLLILIFILSFLSFNSQRKWTSIYKNLLKTRANNNNLIDYISKTEEFYINKIESLNTFKKATPKDLIYLDKQITQNKNNYLNKKIKFIKDGLKDSKYQKGY